LGKTCGKREKAKTNTGTGTNCEGKRPHGKHGQRCEDITKILVTGIRWQCMGRIHLASDKDNW